MIKILIADDHSVVREGLKQIISQRKNMIVAGEAADGHEVLSMAASGKYDLIIMDISMPGKNIMDTLKDLRDTFPKLPVLVLSMHPEERYGVRVLKAGASGYLTKESASSELIKAVETIFNGGKYFSHALAEKLLQHVKTDLNTLPHQKLSNREYEVMLLLAAGISVKDIAEKLNLSVPSISTYRARIMSKMGLKNNTELTFYAIHHELIDKE